MEFGSDWGGKDYDREKKKDIKEMVEIKA